MLIHLVLAFLAAMVCSAVATFLTGVVMGASRQLRGKPVHPTPRALQRPDYVRIVALERELGLIASGGQTCVSCGRIGDPSKSARCWNCGASYTSELQTRSEELSAPLVARISAHPVVYDHLVIDTDTRTPQPTQTQ